MPITSRNDKPSNFERHFDKMGDEMENEEDEFLADTFAKDTAKSINWPSALYAYIKFGYENTMKSQLEADGKTMAEYVDEVMAHVQSYYKDASLPTPIEFKVLNMKEQGFHLLRSTKDCSYIELLKLMLYKIFTVWSLRNHI